MMFDAADNTYMQRALELARDGLGQAWPNPSVGAVLVKNNSVIGEARTAKGGRPHAETQAIEQAGEKAKDATLYVTLEPCPHKGKTFPCTQAIIKAGITRVVVACRDPDPRVSGQGVEALRNAGLKVNEDLCKSEAILLNEGFFRRLSDNRPMINLKIATSLDGKLTAGNGESKWITGEEARMHGHRLRATHDAVLVGIGTVMADNPELTCRAPGMEGRSPVRIVLDSRLRITEECKLAKSARDVPTWVITTEDAALARRDRLVGLERLGMQVLAVASEEHATKFPHEISTSAGVAHFDTRGVEQRTHLQEALHCIASQGITRLLVEAGGTLATSFLTQRIVDRLYWYRAPIILGEEGQAAFQAGFPLTLKEAPRAQREAVVTFDEDMLEIYRFRF